MTDLISITDITDFIKEYQKSKNVELEISFQRLDEMAWDRINDALVDLVDRKNISAEDSLDISVDLGQQRTLRYSIKDTNIIDKIISLRQNQIHGYLMTLRPSKTIVIEVKDKSKRKRVPLPEINATLKLATETAATERQTGMEKLVYRYKNRYSFVHQNVRYDTTRVKQATRSDRLGTAWPTYEAEVEVISTKITPSELVKAALFVVEAIQGTDLVIGKTEARSVLDYYYSILNTSGRIISRNVISMETQHVKFLPNKYTVTEKADGERYLLIIKGDEPYLMSTNAVVKKTGIKLKGRDFDKTILDGELIANAYLAFDVIYAKGIDYRTNTNHTLVQRLAVLNEIIDKAFTLIPFPDYASVHKDFSIGAIVAYYTKEIPKYWKAMSQAMSQTKGLLVTRKLYFVPYGIHEAEVFAYGDLLWHMSLKNIYPYAIDGIIYTPIDSPYLIQVKPKDFDTTPLDYKWKPPAQNSIDFYITFDKDDTGVDAIYLVNGVEYKIAHLHVGREQNREEVPTPFVVNNEEQISHIKIINGEARDSEGTVLNDKSVVEFTFDTQTTGIDNSFRWVAYKYRPDKTESVQKYKRKYGNNVKIAARIWRSINDPLTEQIIATLANPNTFQVEMERLNKPKSYYGKTVATAVGMRAYHNWIKQNLIQMYAHGNVLDIGCGRGGDLQKFVRAKVDLYVGLDIDYRSMYVIPNSAVERYNKMKNYAPPMHFIQADARLPFKADIQANAAKMTDENKTMITQWLQKKYNTVNAQFTLHYYLQDNDSWDNFCQNLNQTMADGAYLLITTFDGKLIFDKLKDKDKITITYDDRQGNRSVMCEIVKTYKAKDSKRVGLGIDVYNALINDPGIYFKEYLVDPDFLKESLQSKCGLMQVESESFYDIYQLYADSFRGENKQVQAVESFYRYVDEKDSETLASFKMSMLNRYYVFKKLGSEKQPARVIGFNRQLSSTKVLAPWFSNVAMKLDDSLAATNINHLYHHIREQYAPVKPSVCLVRHTITKDGNNSFRYSNVKTADKETCIVYRDPEGTFYPLRYKNRHLITSLQALDDLNTMVQISNAFQ